MTLKLALEPLFFFALEFLQNDRLNISSFCGIYFGTITAALTILRTLDSGTNIFCKGTLLSELEIIIGTTTIVRPQLLQLLHLPLTLSHRETEWMMTKELSDKCWKTQSKRWHLLSKQQGQERGRRRKKTVQWLL